MAAVHRNGRKDGAFGLVDVDRIQHRLGHLVSTRSLPGNEKEIILLIRSYLCDIQTRYQKSSPPGSSKVSIQVDYWMDNLEKLKNASGFPGCEVDRSEVPTVCGTIQSSTPGPTILISGHVDVVPVGDESQWITEPFYPLVDNDMQFGRGSASMKGGLVVALEVFESFAHQIASGTSFQGTLKVLFVVGGNDGGIGTFSAIQRGIKPDYCIIPAPTCNAKAVDPMLMVAHAGEIAFEVSVEGRAVAAGYHEKGVCALQAFMTLWQGLQEASKNLPKVKLPHSEMMDGDASYYIHVGTIRGGNWSGSVMDRIYARIRCSVMIGESLEEAESRIRQLLLSISQKNEWLKKHPPTMKVCGGKSLAGVLDQDHRLVRNLKISAEKVFGRAGRMGISPFPLDATQWLAQGIPTLAYGPGNVEVMHAPNEWVSLDVIKQCAIVLTDLCATLLSHGSLQLVSSDATVHQLREVNKLKQQIHELQQANQDLHPNEDSLPSAAQAEVSLERKSQDDTTRAEEVRLHSEEQEDVDGVASNESSSRGFLAQLWSDFWSI